MHLFLFDERGEYNGYQIVSSQRDVTALTNAKVSFVIVPEDETKKLDDTWYVPNVEEGRARWRLEKRPKFRGRFNTQTIAADGVEEAILEGLPIPCTLKVDGEPVVVEDGSFELSATIKGTYTIELDQWPYMPWSAVVRAK